MANLVKVGSHFINIDQALRVDDLHPRTREDKVSDPSPQGRGLSESSDTSS